MIKQFNDIKDEVKEWKFGGFCSNHCVSHLWDYSYTKMPWFIMLLSHELFIYLI